MKYNAVIFDVDSKDIATGLSSPPVEFTTLQFLTSVRLILKDGGKLFIHKYTHTVTFCVSCILFCCFKEPCFVF